MSGAPGVLEFLRYQVAVDWSKTPRVAVPLPSQSPATGIQLCPPYANGATSGAPGPGLWCRYHAAVFGWNTATPAGEEVGTQRSSRDSTASTGALPLRDRDGRSRWAIVRENQSRKSVRTVIVALHQR